MTIESAKAEQKHYMNHNCKDYVSSEMVDVKLPKPLLDKLLLLANGYVNQSNRGGTYPMYFSIRTKELVNDANGSEVDYLDEDGYSVIGQTAKEALQYAIENELIDENRISELKEEHEINDIMDMDDYDMDLILEDIGIQSRNYSYEFKHQNCFLLADSCKQHIKANDYHYNEPVDYADLAWCNPDMATIAQLLIWLGNEEVRNG